MQSPGAHRIVSDSDGPVTVRLDDQLVLDDEPGGSSAAIDLPPGLVPIEVRYEHRSGPAHLSLDWEGPGFPREPIPGRFLFHDAQAITESDRFEEGRRLADRMGCANCHDVPAIQAYHKIGPPLADAVEAIDTSWLARWLTNPGEVRPGTAMPTYGEGLAPADVADLMAFLAVPSRDPKNLQEELQMALHVADPTRGQLLFRSTGCLGCHTIGSGVEVSEERVAPDLLNLGRKRTAEWLASFLVSPRSKSLARHRPDMRLSPDEAAHLASYLAGRPGKIPPRRPSRTGTSNVVVSLRPA